MTYWQNWTQDQFRALPQIEDAWTGDGWWDSLVLLPTRRLHDSGYALFSIIGIRRDGENPEARRILDYDVVHLWELDEFINIDCLYPSRLFRIFAMDREISYNYGRVKARKRTPVTEGNRAT